jgi:hypothetical protein
VILLFEFLPYVEEFLPGAARQCRPACSARSSQGDAGTDDAALTGGPEALCFDE